jgi:hypothetical protein
VADEITALIPLQGEQLLARVDEIVRRIGEDFYELGQHLFEIKTGEVYKDSGHGSWREYCDARLPFQDRKPITTSSSGNCFARSSATTTTR